MQFICRWCNAKFDRPAHSGHPKVFVVAGIAHFEQRRKRSAAVKPITPNIEQSPLLWSEIDARSKRFWADRKPQTVTENVEVAAA